VGDGSYRKSLEELSASLKIESLVRFYGNRPFNEMLEIMAESDATIIPHIRTDNNDASSPNKLYQYMYLNKPIISSDCTSLERIIKETKTGFIYGNNSPEELALLIGKLHKNRNLLDDVEGNGRRAVIEKYNWDIDKLRLIQAYNQLSVKGK
jgi:glycosyltransferase involved in cell wall biosynthesis